MARFPAATALFAALALASQAYEGLATGLQYDRGAILSGQVWRLATCHAAHYGWGHLALNLAVFLPAACVAERRDARGFRLAMAAAALVCGAGFFVLLPGMGVYRGASGLANAALAWLAAGALWRGEKGRAAWGALLALVIIKSLSELWAGETWFLARAGAEGFVTTPWAHALGAATGALAATAPALARRGR